MSKPSVYVSRVLPEPGMRLLQENCDVIVHQGEEPPSRAEFLQKSKHCDGVLVLLTEKVDEEFLNNAPHLKVVSSYSVGLDHVDVGLCTKRGIVVTNTPDVLTEATADFAFALILAASRRLAEGDRFVRSGEWRLQWSPNLLVGRDIHGATLGIIGFGRIGRAVARRAAGFGMRVVYFDRKGVNAKATDLLGATFLELDELLKTSDIVSLHLPLTNETTHFLGRREFSLMKETAVFVNTSRGPVIEQAALIEALKSKKIFAAGLDVFEREPLDKSDPLMGLDNVVLAPHLGSATVQARSKMAELAAMNLIDALQGRVPKALANREVLAFTKLV